MGGYPCSSSIYSKTIFHEINQLAIGDPPCMEPPNHFAEFFKRKLGDHPSYIAARQRVAAQAHLMTTG